MCLLSLDALALQPMICGVVTGTVWPTGPRRVAICSFREKFPNLLARTKLCVVEDRGRFGRRIEEDGADNGMNWDEPTRQLEVEASHHDARFG